MGKEFNIGLTSQITFENSGSEYCYQIITFCGDAQSSSVPSPNRPTIVDKTKVKTKPSENCL